MKLLERLACKVGFHRTVANSYGRAERYRCVRCNAIIGGGF